MEDDGECVDGGGENKGTREDMVGGNSNKAEDNEESDGDDMKKEPAAKKTGATKKPAAREEPVLHNTCKGNNKRHKGGTDETMTSDNQRPGRGKGRRG